VQPRASVDDVDEGCDREVIRVPYEQALQQRAAPAHLEKLMGEQLQRPADFVGVATMQMQLCERSNEAPLSIICCSAALDGETHGNKASSSRAAYAHTYGVRS
jgi:hypothetical protein